MDSMLQLIIAEQEKQELVKVLDCNKKSQKFGLVLSEKEAKELMVCRKNVLKETQRVEFGESILSGIIEAFCDSQFINQDEYRLTLSKLQEIFYTFKNETQDKLTDEELLDFMRQQFEEVCFGDLDYLRDTCLNRYAKTVRSGYQGKMQFGLRDEYEMRDTENEYNRFSEETRWDMELYALRLEDTY